MANSSSASADLVMRTAGHGLTSGSCWMIAASFGQLHRLQGAEIERWLHSSLCWPANSALTTPAVATRKALACVRRSPRPSAMELAVGNRQKQIEIGPAQRGSAAQRRQRGKQAAGAHLVSGGFAEGLGADDPGRAPPRAGAYRRKNNPPPTGRWNCRAAHRSQSRCGRCQRRCAGRPSTRLPPGCARLLPPADR